MNYTNIARPLIYCSMLAALPTAVGCVSEFRHGSEACEDDAFFADDNPSVESDSGTNTDDDGNCPSEETSIYLGRTSEVCDFIEFTCPADYTPFNAACGCGCEPLPEEDICPTEDGEGITVLSRDLKVCQSITFNCPEGDTQFNGTCGCGCIADTSSTGGGLPACPDPEDPKVHYLGEQGSAQCELVDFTCPPECLQFNDSCGCGCIEP